VEAKRAKVRHGHYEIDGRATRLDFDDFRATLSSSRLCQPNDWPDDVDEMAAVYDVELTGLLDR